VISSGAKKFWWFLLGSKLIVSVFIPLVPDETYYWVWSHHLQLSYYDHPPMVALWFWLGHALENFGGLVRWPAIALTHLSGLVWLRVFGENLSSRQQVYWLALWACTPLTGPGSLFVTPDLPLLLFWSLSLWAFSEWVKRPTLIMAFLSGGALGLGFTSKYPIVLLVPILTMVLIYSKPSAKVLLKNLAPLALGFILFSSPVWLWNFQNNWISFKFQFSHGLGHHTWKPSWTLDYIGAQVALLFPLVLYWAARAKAPLIFHLAAWFPLLFFAATTLRGYAEANWPIVAHPVILFLAVRSTYSSRKALQAICAFWLLAFLIALSQALWSWMPFDPRKLKTREFLIYDHLAESVAPYSPLFSRSYQLASYLNYRLRRPVYKLAGMNRMDFYDFLPEARPATRRYYLLKEKIDPLPQEWVDLGHKPIRQISIDDQFEIVEIESP